MVVLIVSYLLLYSKTILYNEYTMTFVLNKNTNVIIALYNTNNYYRCDLLGIYIVFAPKF